MSATTHYDLPHNIVLLASGRKRFTLLPPSAHDKLQLHPRWHGSQRQAQVHLPRVLSELNEEVVVVTLQSGDALYIPPLWFHFVETLSSSVSVNFWTDSFFLDSWVFLTDRRRWSEHLFGNFTPARPLNVESLLQTARAIMSMLIESLEMKGALNGVAKELLKQRYASDDAASSAWDIKVWDSSMKNFDPLDAHKRRSTVSTSCRAHKERNGANFAALGTAALVEIQEYANLLNTFDDGVRVLLVHEWTDEFSVWVLGDAASSNDLELGDSCVGVFWESCLVE